MSARAGKRPNGAPAAPKARTNGARARVPVAKTYKLYVDGKFPRSESGRYYPLERDGRLVANVCRASRKDFRDAVVAASERSGEPMWAMPLPPELRRGLDSATADFVNANADRLGGMLVAGHFLAEFVPEGLPWAHIDVAGPAYNTGAPWGYTPKGGTGVPVRTLLATIEDLISHS